MTSVRRLPAGLRVNMGEKQLLLPFNGAALHHVRWIGNSVLPAVAVSQHREQPLLKHSLVVPTKLLINVTYVDIGISQLRLDASHVEGAWFVVQHKPNAQSLAVRNLERQNVRVFAPFEEVKKRRSSVTMTVRRPLFPGYLFVNFDIDNFRWRAVNSTVGVSRIVSFGQACPLALPRSLITELQSRCDFSGRLLPPTTVQAGDLVRITKGPLADFVATVEKMAPQQRVWVLLDLVGRATRVTIDVADLQVTTPMPFDNSKRAA